MATICPSNEDIDTVVVLDRIGNADALLRALEDLGVFYDVTVTVRALGVKVDHVDGATSIHERPGRSSAEVIGNGDHATTVALRHGAQLGTAIYYTRPDEDRPYRVSLLQRDTDGFSPAEIEISPDVLVAAAAMVPAERWCDTCGTIRGVHNTEPFPEGPTSVVFVDSVERCDQCRIYPGDLEAAAALRDHLGLHGRVMFSDGSAEPDEEGVYPAREWHGEADVVIADETSPWIQAAAS
jgi:hypothetical protein